MTDPNPATPGRDQLWGGDGDDAMWGGRGDGDEWGGFGKGHIDVFPRPAFAGDKKNGPKPADPPEWSAPLATSSRISTASAEAGARTLTG